MKLRPGLRELDESFIIDQDKRIKAFRAKQWERLEGFEPFEMATLVCLAGAAIGLLTLMGLIIFWVKFVA